jgi:hypothetical protein
MFTVPLWQAVALSLGMEPEEPFKPEWHGGLGVRRNRLRPDYIKRLEIACNHVENGQLPVDRWVENAPFREVKLPAFAAWALAQGWKLPKPFPGRDAAAAPKSPRPDRSAKAVSAKEERWYRDEYVPDCKKAGTLPSREDDSAAAQGAGLNLSRDRLRQLRKMYAPKNWKIPGRRKTGAANSGHQ